MKIRNAVLSAAFSLSIAASPVLAGDLAKPASPDSRGSSLVSVLPAPLRRCVERDETPPVVGTVRQSRYVPAEDETPLALDIFLPENLGEGERLPTVLFSTRYWRGKKGGGMPAELETWSARGYAVVTLDVRGTGASYGRWTIPYTENEARDIGHIAHWIVGQSWSDGKVVTTGNSYPGTTSLMSPAFGAPAIQAIIPRFSDFDMYNDLLYPGGVPARRLIADWGALVKNLDLNKPVDGATVRPIDGDKGDALLNAAIAEHKAVASNFADAVDLVTYKDQKIKEFDNLSFADGGVYSLGDPISASGTPILGWGSWYDAGIAQGMVNRFNNWRNPQISIIGPWTHGARADADPFKPVNAELTPSKELQTRINVCFAELALSGDFAKGGETSRILYYVVGADEWRSTHAWPVKGASPKRYNLLAHGRLGASTTGERAVDAYTVNFSATTGLENRWMTQIGVPDIDYGDRAAADRLLLTYTSEPLEKTVEMTGQGMVRLLASSNQTDGNFIVYLEDVAPDGRVTYITEGQLRAIHRNLSKASPPYRTTYPYRSFSTADASPLVPGEMVELEFPLHPISAVFQKGHRIRIAIAGADKDTFLQIPREPEGDVTIRMAVGGANRSYVELPVIRPFETE